MITMGCFAAACELRRGRLKHGHHGQKITEEIARLHHETFDHLSSRVSQHHKNYWVLQLVSHQPLIHASNGKAFHNVTFAESENQQHVH